MSMAINNTTKLNFQEHTILIVDDTPANLGVIVDYLEDYGFETSVARDGESALRTIQYARPDIILLDVLMPGIDGFETCRRLKADEIAKDIPVIFMTALADTEHKVKGFEVGAVDYVVKPLQQEEVLARLTTHLCIRHLARSLQEKNRQLAKLNAEKDKFFASVAHDLRDPFNSLLGNSHLIFTDMERLPKEKLQEMAEQVYTSAGTIHNLVETLMTWSSMQRIHVKHQPAEVNLGNLTHQMVELWQETATRKNIELTNDIIEEDLYVYGDEAMLAAIIRNLIANALKFTQSGGWVRLSAWPGDSSSTGQGKEEGEFIEVCVKDMGIGISEENIAKLFRIDVQHTTPGTAKEKGAGLGLIMCKEMAEYHGGRIWVESKPGRGTTVKFTVPVAQLSNEFFSLRTVSKKREL